MKKLLPGVVARCLRGRLPRRRRLRPPGHQHPAVTAIVPIDREHADRDAAHARRPRSSRSCRRRPSRVPINGTSTTESGPTLASLLTYAGVQYNAACKNDELRYWVEATNAKGAGGRDHRRRARPRLRQPAGDPLDRRERPLPDLAGPAPDRPERHAARVTCRTSASSPSAAHRSSSPTPPRPPAARPALVPAPAAGSVVINGDVADPTTLHVRPAAGDAAGQPDDQLPLRHERRARTPRPGRRSTRWSRRRSRSSSPATRTTSSASTSRSPRARTATLDACRGPRSTRRSTTRSRCLARSRTASRRRAIGPRSTVPGDVKGGRYISGSAVMTVLRAPTEVRIPSCAKSK